MTEADQVRAALKYAGTRRDFHVSEIKRVARIRKGRYEDTVALHIMQMVKDVAPFELWAVYERKGWWTTQPTHEVRLVNLYRTTVDIATRLERHAQLMTRHRPGDGLTQMARVSAHQARALVELFESDLPALDRQEDTCLARIDKLMAA